MDRYYKNLRDMYTLFLFRNEASKYISRGFKFFLKYYLDKNQLLKILLLTKKNNLLITLNQIQEITFGV